MRAGILITGTEVLSGIISDRNGPWLSERLREHGVEVAEIVIVADRRADMLEALRFMGDLDLVVTSGGLGPTADDMTAEVVADYSGRPLALDSALEERIWKILERLRSRWRNLDEDAIRASNRKQALVPDGRHRARAGRHRARPRGAGPADRAGAARAAARAAADVGDGAADRADARAARARGHLRAADHAPVRDPGVGDRALAA